MRCKMDLVNPIMINGEEVKSLEYDFQKITTKDIMELEQYFDLADKDFMMKPSYCAAITIAAIIKVNPGIDIMDLIRIEGADAILLSFLGRNFIFLSEEGSPVKTSEDASDSTQDASAHQ